MTNLLARSYQGELPNGKGSHLCVAPAGRVIRSVNHNLIPRTSPANVDALPTSRRNIIRRGSGVRGSLTPKQRVNLLGMVCTGFLIGTISSMVLFLPGGPVGGLSSNSILNALKRNLTDDPQVSQTYTRAHHRNVIRTALVKSPDRVSETRQNAPTLIPHQTAILSDAGGGSGTQRMRLASFVAMPQEKTQATTVPQVIRPLSRVLGAIERPTSRGVVGRVHSIIRKYAPKHQSPHVLAEAIVAESKSLGYDPLFVAAVIKAESTFNPVARSHKGAQGLMQIMPATGAWLAKRNDLPQGKLTDTGHNLRLGITYLKQLESEYSGDKVFTLVAYNWGPGHVQSAAGGKRRIPKECMTYALKILKDYQRWQSGLI